MARPRIHVPAPWYTRPVVLWGTLLLLTGLAYLPAVGAKWIWDDDLWITQNQLLRTPEGLGRIWTDPLADPEYYPLTLSHFWLDYQLWGLNPVGFHVENIVLHGINAILVYLLLRRLRISGAWLAAAIFAVHPINVESVAWATERKNTLSGFMALWSVICFVIGCGLDAADDQPRKVRWKWVIASIAFYAAAILSKTVLITLPGVLGVLIWWRRGRLGVRDLLTILPHALIGLPLAAFATWMQIHHTGATGPEFALAPIQRVLIAGRALCFYLGKLAWPWPVMFVYPKWVVDPGQLWQFGWPVLAVAILVGLIVLLRRTGRSPLAAFLIFGGMLLPALGFFNIYWHRYTYVADHVQYHAAVAVFALFAAGVCATLRVTQRSRVIGSGLLLVVLTAMSFRQATLYADNEPLLRDTLRYNPDSGMAHDNLAHTLSAKGRMDEAIAEFRISLKLSPQLAERQMKAQFNLAVALEKAGQLPEAIDYYRLAMTTSPTYASPRYNLGNICLGQKKYPEAIALYEEVVKIEPEHPEAENNLGSAYLLSGEPAKAIPHLQRVEVLQPRQVGAKVNLGLALLKIGDAPGAAAAFKRALEVDPNLQVARAGLQMAQQRMLR